MVVGWWRPRILVPPRERAELSVLQLEAPLAHELAHIRRHGLRPLMHRPELAKLETETLRALRTSRDEPVTYPGRPIEGRYVFQIVIRMPSLG